MQKTTLLLGVLGAISIALLAATATVHAAPPQVECWRINVLDATGYGGLFADVRGVKYNDTYVYASSSGIPSYSIGPWPGNPGSPTDGNWTFRIARNPQPKTGTKTATGLGHIGVWVNGVTIFNASDARSYNNKNVWHQNAIIVEGPGFDACGGHPAMVEYHNHQNANCMFTESSQMHSAIVGFAFDGYPIYGPYGYTNTDGSGEIRRIKSSYRKRSITTRTTLANGTVLTSANYGPAISTMYPLGYYIEDYELVTNLGDLDLSNGRVCVTPEFPQGTYAYFVTLDAAGSPEYPYIIGPSYYGVVDTANTGAGGGKVVVPTGAVTYNPFDLDESGSSDFGDIAVMLLNYGSRGPGDFDLDGVVGNGDLALMLLNF